MSLALARAKASYRGDPGLSIRGIGNALKRAAPIARFIPGLNTAVAIGGAVAGAAGMIQAARRPVPLGGGQVGGGEWLDKFIAVVGRQPTAEEWQVLDDTAAPQRASLLESFKAAPPRIIPGVPSGRLGMTPGWGNLARRGGAVVAGSIGRMIKGGGGKRGKWVKDIVAGTAVWYLIDKATGAILGQRDTPPPRRMNVLNPKALKRADRRVDGFVKVSRKILSDVGFTVARKGAGGCKKKKSCR